MANEAMKRMVGRQEKMIARKKESGQLKSRIMTTAINLMTAATRQQQSLSARRVIQFRLFSKREKTTKT